MPPLLGLVLHAAVAAETVAPGPFSDGQCIDCHQQRDPDLVAQWRKGPHGPSVEVGCTACHGDGHLDANPRARKELSCNGCHDGSAARSYATSKHGVISRLYGNRQDWSQQLRRGNYRAPTCAYCHAHDGDHGDSMAPRRGPHVRQWICAGCHSPRYVRELLAAGTRQLEIADLKLAEGEGLIALMVGDHGGALAKLGQSLAKHRRNVLLGIGHQSPDYQWWHGQPALDGDLIRIRDVIHRRDRQFSGSAPKRGRYPFSTSPPLGLPRGR